MKDLFTKSKEPKPPRLTKHEQLQEKYRAMDQDARQEELLIMLQSIRENMYYQNRKLKSIDGTLTFFLVVTIICGLFVFFSSLASV